MVRKSGHVWGSKWHAIKERAGKSPARKPLPLDSSKIIVVVSENQVLYEKFELRRYVPHLSLFTGTVLLLVTCII